MAKVMAKVESVKAETNGTVKTSETSHEIPELYRRYRPTKFKDVIGQPEVVKVLDQMVRESKVPHALLFTGPSGVGKTTLARILASKLGCDSKLAGTGKHSDFIELNAAESRGIDTIRSIDARKDMAAIGGRCRVWLLDEAQSLSSDAQSALLKILEDTPPHVYFMLATTDPQKLKKTIITRCTEFRLTPVPEDDILELLKSVSEKEELTIGEEVLQKISENCDCGPRKALVLLHQVKDLETDEERLEAILKADLKKQAIDLCRLLINPRSKWSEVSKLLRDLKDEDPEQVRRVVLGYSSSVLLNRDDHRAYLIICAFEGNFFDSGKAGLVRAAYEVYHDK